MGNGRDAIVDYIRKELLGPSDGPTELTDNPLEIYTTGILYPRVTSGSSSYEYFEDDFNDIAAQAEDGTSVDESLSNATLNKPSCVGVSFFLTCDSDLEPKINVEVSASIYSRKDNGWRREPFSDEVLPFTTSGSKSCFEGKGRVLTSWRKSSKGFIVTVALENAITGQRSQSADNCLFQVGIQCEAIIGEIGTYPRVESLLSNDEEAELRLRYDHERVYSVGHGCAGEWKENTTGSISVHSEFIPSVEVPPTKVVTDENSSLLSLRFLSTASSEDLSRELSIFVEGYVNWLEGEKAKFSAEDPAPHAKNAGHRIFSRIEDAINRMKDGIKYLESPDVLRSFQLAQTAMIHQMKHSETGLGGSQFTATQGPNMPEPSDYANLERSWYPFQLAYILMCLESTMNHEDRHRGTVDLIGASTGAGKTEAYLALAAMSIIHRRSTEGKRSGGTVVMTRYTLRLLTLQQFERTARLACALETLRREMPDELGQEEISIGLWVGEDTPRSFADAKKISNDLFEANRPQEMTGFPLRKCPWCGTEIVPKTDSPNKSHYGFPLPPSNNSFNFFCPNQNCSFSDKLPIQVVDDALYENPPTILIGTVDKFARLAWVAGAGNFFGVGDNLPPSLIIQDELHLLEGPLGTTAGIYEASIGVLCEIKGRRPKVLASTATIREAEAQIKSIYGNQTQLFPPSGRDSRSSYFVEERPDQPGRLYLGVLSAGNTPATSFIRTSAAILQSHPAVDSQGGLDEFERDGYWTLVAYHNSIRELGATLSAANDDINSRLQFIGEIGNTRELNADVVMELSSKIENYLVPAALQRLETKHDQPEALSFIACTKMLSVGVDINRLGIMIVHGQPMTTSEYIQSTSRVGRQPDRIPGIVITHYSASKSRDRSHYERFRPYHSSLYRWVEPTSVTPFSLPSRDRSLPASLVTLIRHGVEGMAEEESANIFDPNHPTVQEAIEKLLQRVEAADESEFHATEEEISRLIHEWSQQTQEDYVLTYQGGGLNNPSVLTNFTTPNQGLWKAMNSMRNVDQESPLEIIKAKVDNIEEEQ